MEVAATRKELLATSLGQFNEGFSHDFVSFYSRLNSDLKFRTRVVDTNRLNLCLHVLSKYSMKERQAPPIFLLFSSIQQIQ